jgi:hypothetical protein
MTDEGAPSSVIVHEASPSSVVNDEGGRDFNLDY